MNEACLAAYAHNILKIAEARVGGCAHNYV